MRYVYDSFGRLTEVWSPYDTGTMPAVRYEYAWQGKGSYTGNWYAVTSNKIKYNPDDYGAIRTVMTIDGLGRGLQVAKDGEYRDDAGARHYGWNVSGTVVYDSAGRTIAEGKPVFVEGASYPALAGLDRPLTKAYDSLDRVTTVTESDGSVVSMSYGIQQGRLYQKTVDPLMNVSIQFSDIRGNILEVQRLNSSGTVLTSARYEYNALGEMLRALDDKGTPVTVSYDLLGRKTALESLDSGRVEYSYDTASNVIRKTDSNLRAKGEAISYVYDELNRLVKTDYPRSTDVTYVYGGPETAGLNGAGRLLSITDGTGTTSYSYGMLGEVTGKSRTIQRLTGFTDPETATFAYSTNYLGQMDAITYPDGEVITYRYDRGGNLSGVTGTLQSDYDPVVTEYVKDIAYNPEGQRTYIEYANGVRTKYEYDEDRSWLSSIQTTNGVGYTFQNMNYSFDRVGNVLGYTNDAETYRTSQSYSYDSLYQLTGAQGSTLNKPTAVTGTYSQTYAFDSIGNMTTKTSTASANGSLPMGADLNYNLDYAYYNNGKSHQAERIGNIWFRYDTNGNVIEAREGGHSPVTAMTGTVNTSGGISSVNYGFGLDRDTEAQEDTAWKRTYAWDEENRMIRSVEKTMQVEYRYGSDGQRAVKYSSRGETLYFDSMWTLSSDGADLKAGKHVYAGTTRIATRLRKKTAGSGGSYGSLDYVLVNTYYYHTDHLGSAQLVTDAKGDEYEHIEYTPYGELFLEQVRDGLESLPYRFTGKELDPETGLYYYGARYLDPKTSLWLSSDPALGEYIPAAPVNAGFMNCRQPYGLLKQSTWDDAKKHNQNLPGMGGVFNTVNLHLYHYAGNNPIKYVDPDGRAPRNLSNEQRSEYMIAVMILVSSISNIPSSYDCTDLTLYIYNRAMEAATGVKGSYQNLWHGNSTLGSAGLSLTYIQARDMNPEYQMKNIMFYSGDGQAMSRNPSTFDTNFYSSNVEIGTVGILKPAEGATGFTGHTYTVIGFTQESFGIRTGIWVMTGGQDHPPQIWLITPNGVYYSPNGITNDLDSLIYKGNDGLNMYSDCVFIGWGEVQPQ